jgi:hypothetical protein
LSGETQPPTAGRFKYRNRRLECRRAVEDAGGIRSKIDDSIKL